MMDNSSSFSISHSSNTLGSSSIAGKRARFTPAQSSSPQKDGLRRSGSDASIKSTDSSTSNSPSTSTTTASYYKPNWLRYLLVVLGMVATVPFCLQAMQFVAVHESNQLVDNRSYIASHQALALPKQRHLRTAATFTASTTHGAFDSIAAQVQEQLQMEQQEASNSKANRRSRNSNATTAFAGTINDDDDSYTAINLDDFTTKNEEETTSKDSTNASLDFSNAPPPRNLTRDEHVAACLLIKDDNHWLIEWLAYHYHVMPLRKLIVVVDPSSRTSPRKILRRWTMLMDITVWKDEDFMPAEMPPYMQHAYRHTNNTALMQHRFRQNSFYRHCMQHLKQKHTHNKHGDGAEWIHLTDTDEFIAINYASGPLYNLTQHHPIQQPGSVLRFLHHHQDALAKLGQQQQEEDCIYMPRYMFGAKESPRGLVERNIPHKLHPHTQLKGQDMLTQRYLYRQVQRMSNGKNLIRLGGAAWKPLANVHRVSAACPTTDSLLDVNFIRQTLVKVHHYLGTPEQYLFRSDPRSTTATSAITTTKHNSTQDHNQPLKGMGSFFERGMERYSQLNRQAIYKDSAARGWIAGFINNVGIQMAEYLLQGVGQVGVE